MARKQQKPNSEPKAKKRIGKVEPKPWGWKNQVGKQFTEQSKRDPFYSVRQAEKQERINARKEQLLKQVQSSLDSTISTTALAVIVMSLS